MLIILLLCVPFCSTDIIGLPSITCTPDGIHAVVNMTRNFVGKIYLRGHYGAHGCSVDYAANATDVAQPLFAYDACHLRRKRQSNPQGMIMSAVMVVAHHPTLITYRDAAYNIECFYREHDSNVVQTDLNVNAAESVHTMRSEPALPKCSYEVEVNSRKGNTKPIDNSLSMGDTKEKSTESIDNLLSVGDTVTHVWSCANNAPNDVYCMQVHSCVAQDDRNDKVTVVDERGCSNDLELLSSLSYSSQLKASATSRVFKFAESSDIRFLCQIRLSLKKDFNNTCPTPQCDRSTRSKRSAGSSFDVESRRMTVLENGRVAFFRSAKSGQVECPVLSIPLIVVSIVSATYTVFSICYCWNRRNSSVDNSLYYNY